MKSYWLQPGVFREDLDAINKQVPQDIQSLANKNVLLTGSTGFVGTWLAASLLHGIEAFDGAGSLACVARSFESLDNYRSQIHSHPKVKLLPSDIRSLDISTDFKFDLVIHAATPASATFNQFQPMEMISTIVDGQKRILDQARRIGAQKVLFLSSGAVYGKQPLNLNHLPVDWEGGPNITDTSNAYHEAKRLAELMGYIAAQKGDFEFVTARLFAFLAPFLPTDQHFAAGNFIADALKGNFPQVKGNGATVRSYQYGSDMTSWLWAIANRGQNQTPYNIGSDEELSISNLAAAVARSAGISHVQREGYGSPSSPVSRYVPDISATTSELNVSNMHPIAVAITRTLRWHRETTPG